MDKQEKYRLEEDWKIDVRDKDGNLIIKDGEPVDKKAA